MILYTILATHLTIVCVTLYLHRGQAHLGIVFHPVVSHIMRFWLWLTTGMVTKEWVAVHRKHHRYTDMPADPHSPVTHGVLAILFGGVLKYKQAASNSSMVKMYGSGTPNDWIERNLYTPYSAYGLVVLAILNVVAFGPDGLFAWLVQILWIPFWAAGVVNGIGHWFGYRNFATKDNSRNIVPLGVIIGGEELHNNHHNNPASAKLSVKPWEFDIGWMWLQLLVKLKLARVVNRG